jgi:ParB-like chromosome segregation protein Spo0J
VIGSKKKTRLVLITHVLLLLPLITTHLNVFLLHSRVLLKSSPIYLYIVAYLLKARTVEPEKQSLLANGSETIFVSRQRLGKHVPAAMDTYVTIEVLLETVFSTRSVQRGHKED